jgi:hypothetical protein
MASIWKFASTRGLIFLADAQSADPEELEVLDTFLPKEISHQGFLSHYCS